MPFRSGAHGTYVPCGTCPACLSAKANKRASLIRSTNPEGTTCYFVTLTYSNDFLPYVDLNDLIRCYDEYYEANRSVDSLSSCPFIVPVYRNCYYTYGHGSEVLHREPKQVGFITRESLKLSRVEFNNELGSLMFPVSGHSDFDMTGKISVAFHEDKDKFLNRLRRKVYDAIGSYRSLKFYYAPEYGPTTARFHIHFIIWCDDKIDYNTFKSFVKDCWPYMDYKQNREFCEIAVNASSYVSQYVNCSAEISPLLLDIAPLRCSHSLGIGFDVPEFHLNTVTPSESNFNFDFHKEFVSPSGSIKSYHFTLPPRVGYRYFPRCKSFSYLNEEKVVELYTRVFYMPVLTYNCGYRDGKDLYYMPGTTVFGQPITVTQSEYRTFRNRLIKAYLNYRKFRPISLQGFFRQIFAYYSKYSLFRYYLQFNDSDYHGFNDFDNMDAGLSTVVAPGQHLYSCNDVPYNIEDTEKLTKQYKDNIKQRKLNYSSNRSN